MGRMLGKAFSRLGRWSNKEHIGELGIVLQCRLGGDKWLPDMSTKHIISPQNIPSFTDFFYTCFCAMVNLVEQYLKCYVSKM